MVRKSLENPSIRIAAGLLAAGLGASALSGCSAVEKHMGTAKTPVLANQCFTDFVGNVKNEHGEVVQRFLPSYGVVLSALENRLESTTGNRNTDGYHDTGTTSKAIQNELVEQYENEGVQINTNEYSVKEKKPFNKALFNFCVNQEGILTPGIEPGIDPSKDPLDHCIVIYDMYTKEISKDPNAFKDCFEGEIPTPSTR